MRQAIHIFGKDARHCRPYIAVVLALTAVNAWLGCQDVQVSPDRLGWILPFLTGLAWWFAISAAVHGESLIGDCQFWVTRPYSWKSLLAAKLLFLAAFVGLPVFVSDCVILLACGFNPLTQIPGLALRQCWLAGFLALPFAVAALTRLTRDFVLTGLGFYAVFLVMALFDTGFDGMAGWEPAWVRDGAPWLLPLAALSLAVWQYSRRRTTLIRVLAMALAPIAPLLTMPALSRGAHPALPQDGPRYRGIALQLDPGRGYRDSSPNEPSGAIYIPIKIGGWPAGLATARGEDVSLLQDGGVVWTHGYMAADTYSDGTGWIVFNPPENLRAATVDLSAPMDLEVYEERGGVALPPDGGWAYIPGFGTVAARDVEGGRVLIARTPLKPAGPEWRYRLNGRAWDGVWDSYDHAAPVSPLAFRIGSVCRNASGLGGTPPPVFITAKRLVAVLHRELNIPQVRLADYQIQKP